ncbi:Protein disulfide isomerase-like 1-1 [Linum grandiflorum]
MASRISISFFFALFLISAVSAAEEESKEFVLTLDHSNFTDTVTNHDFIVVEFYAPWYHYHFTSASLLNLFSAPVSDSIFGCWRFSMFSFLCP